MLANHVFWRFERSSTLTCCSCCNLQSCGFLLFPLIMMQNHRQKWILCKFDVSRMYHPTLKFYMAKFDPGWEGYPVWQTGLATRLGGSPHLSCKRDQIKMRDHMDRQVTPSKRVTSPTLGPPPPCYQALRQRFVYSGSVQKVAFSSLYSLIWSIQGCATIQGRFLSTLSETGYFILCDSVLIINRIYACTIDLIC